MITLIFILAGYLPLCHEAPALEHGDAPEPCSYRSGVPVLTYHQVSETPYQYGVTPDKLWNDLQALYDAGFFLILPDDMENGLYRVPWNRRPLMISFDDGWEDNFHFIEQTDGTRVIDPDCAVAIVNRFLDEHSDFGPGVLFFISWDKVPFGHDTEEKLNMVLDMGHAIGNHTADHTSFMQIPVSDYHSQILPALASFSSRLGMRAWFISSLAYPGGQLPSRAGAEEILLNMEYEGRKAVTQGYLVDGAVENLRRFYESSGEGRLRISRIDMALYSVPQLLQWQNLMQPGLERPSLHDQLPWRP
ncbi:hypothetical protein CSA37_12675 [Candidatus Fermentibacteria bacterium]|nr:MAG: hypothetical protein CSA37_12675 [Candidatus Fermentibacteria bacterium]